MRSYPRKGGWCFFLAQKQKRQNQEQKPHENPCPAVVCTLYICRLLHWNGSQLEAKYLKESSSESNDLNQFIMLENQYFKKLFRSIALYFRILHTHTLHTHNSHTCRRYGTFSTNLLKSHRIETLNCKFPHTPENYGQDVNAEPKTLFIAIAITVSVACSNNFGINIGMVLECVCDNVYLYIVDVGRSHKNKQLVYEKWFLSNSTNFWAKWTPSLTGWLSVSFSFVFSFWFTSLLLMSRLLFRPPVSLSH